LRKTISCFLSPPKPNPQTVPGNGTWLYNYGNAVLSFRGAAISSVSFADEHSHSFVVGIVLLDRVRSTALRYRVAKTHTIPYLFRSISAK